jgi:hypothetical protein
MKVIKDDLELVIWKITDHVRPCPGNLSIFNLSRSPGAAQSDSNCCWYKIERKIDKIDCVGGTASDGSREQTETESNDGQIISQNARVVFRVTAACQS